jgi:hypothetical protein
MSSKKTSLRVVGTYFLLIVLIAGAGFGVLSTLNSNGLTGSFSSNPSSPLGSFGPNASVPLYGNPFSGLQATIQTAMSTTTESFGSSGGTGSNPSGTVVVPNLALQQTQPGVSEKVSLSSIANRIQFFSNLTLRVSSIQTATSNAVALAYSEGGYVAYSSITNGSAFVVLRVPAGAYHDALAKVEAFGAVVSGSSTSNDVTIKVINLNATLQSLLSEKASLLKIMNQTTSVNSTLQIEAQIQSIDAQVNSIESQILVTQRLVDYSTISVTFLVQEVTQTLSMKLTAAPLSGQSPLSVTLNSLVKGGVPGYIVNYNFGDGYSLSAQGVVHTFYSPGTYNVTATATDSAGSVVQGWIIIRVSNPPTQDELSRFTGYVSSLLVGVIEGIVEVVVVVVPIGLIVLAIAFPLRRKFLGSPQPAKQSTDST